MPKRFTGIRLLLVFIAVNVVMILALITSMTSAHPWLSHILPGHFETGADSSGYWVFFALVLLVDALTVFIAGLALMLPGLLEGTPVDERRLTRHLVDRGGMSDEAKEAVFVSLREDAVNAHYQVFVGRAILFAGAVFLALAFSATLFTFARAVPNGEMFVGGGQVAVVLPHKGMGLVVTRTGLVPVKNRAIHGRDIMLFTADQVLAAAALNAPQIYGVQFAPMTNNLKLPLFTHFIFAFRTVLGFTLVLIIISFLRQPARPKREKKTIESVEAKLEEVKG